MKAPALVATVSIGFVAWLLLPTPLFLIAAVVVAIVAAICVAGYWYEQALRVEAERIHLVFEVAGLEIDLAAMTEDYESTLTRLSEVLDEHSLCPVPVEAVEEVPGLAEHTAQAIALVVELTGVNRIADKVDRHGNVKPFPTQRKGSRS